MRMTSLAAAVVTLSLAAYPVANAITRGAGAALAQGTSPRGPLPPPGTPRNTTAEQQEAPPQEPPQAPGTIQVQTTVVNVFATVRDRHNGVVPDLTKDDFKVYEDGVEQKVAYFTKEVDMPLSMAILMDTSGSMQQILNAEQDAASRFVHEVMHKKDEALVMSFDTDVNLLADFTEDPGVLSRAIRRATINAAGPMITPGTVPMGSGGGTNLYDAIYLACHDELSSEAGRKAIVILTDAEDTGSKMTEQDAIESAQRADSVIHILLITDPRATEGYGPGVASRMTQDTGGRVVNVRSEKSLEKAFDLITEELRSQYVLGYSSTNTKRDGTFRKIKVEVNRPDVKVLARKGYYAPG